MHSTVKLLWQFELNILDTLCAMLFLKLKILQRTYGSLAILLPNNFAVLIWLDSGYFLKYYMHRAKTWVDYYV